MNDYSILLFTTISIALIHTLSGPDHYLPFIVLAKAKKWKLPKTLFITFICGIGHVGSSLLIGYAVVFLGWNLAKVTIFENLRASWSSWAFVLLGFGYTLWSIYLLAKNRTHRHFDLDDPDEVYVYSHQHEGLVNPEKRFKVTPWVLFIVFVGGPCEPLIPLLLYPAIQHSLVHTIQISLVFTLTTLAVMLAVVTLGYLGFQLFSSQFMHKYSNLLAGITLLGSGLAMVFLGL